MKFPCSYCPRAFPTEQARDHHQDHCTAREGNPRCVLAHCQEAADI